MQNQTLINNTNWEDIEPNFTRNRFDLYYPDNSFLLECVINNKKRYIPVYQEGSTCELGIYLTEFSQDEFSELVNICFKEFKSVKRLRIASATIRYEKNVLLDEATDYVTILPDSEDEFLEKLSAQSRYNLKRKQKKLFKDFEDIQIKTYHNDIPDSVIEKYFEYKKFTHHKNYHLSPQEYLHQYHVTDAYVLLIDNNIEAIAFNSVVGKNAYLENVTYNTQLSKYSLGILIMYEMIKDCIANKYNQIFWGTYNEYKKHFANKEILTYTGYIYKHTLPLLLKNFFKKFRF